MTTDSTHPGSPPGANATWHNATGGVAPPPHGDASTAFDIGDGYLLQFGGDLSSSALAGDTWALKQGQWTELCSGTSQSPSCSSEPSARDGADMAYDVRDGYIVLFGGWALWGPNNQTWIFTHGTWTNITTRMGPPADAYGVMAYDSADGDVVLCLSTGATWEFKTGNWIRVPGATFPGRMDPTLFFDPVENYTVLFGGYTGSGTSYSTTLVFAAGAWTQLSVATHPSRRAYSASFFDPTSGVGILLGGFGGVGYPGWQNDTWAFRAGNWTNLTDYEVVSPPVRSSAGAAFDSIDGYGILTQGQNYTTYFNDTWYYVDPFSRGTASVDPSLVDVGQNFTVRAAASGGIAPYSFTYSGLPPGCAGSNTSAVSCRPSSPGQFVIVVDVNGGSWGNFTKSLSVTVNPLPDASPTVIPNPTTDGIPVAFTANATGGTPPLVISWSILFAGETTGSSFLHTFRELGKIPGRLYVNDSLGGSFEFNFSVTVNPGLFALIKPGPRTTDVGMPLTFGSFVEGGTLPLSISWLVDDGGRGLGGSISHGFSMPGNHTVTLLVNDSAGASTEVQTYVNVYPGLTLQAMSNTTRTYAGIPIGFDASSFGGAPPQIVLWRFGDGASTQASTATHAYSSPGNYTAEAQAYDAAGASANVTIPIHILAANGSSGSVIHSPPRSNSNELSSPLVLGLLILAASGVAAGIAYAAYVRRRAGST